MHVIIPINNLSAFLSKLDYSGSFYYIFKKQFFKFGKTIAGVGGRGMTPTFRLALYMHVYIRIRVCTYAYLYMCVRISCIYCYPLYFNCFMQRFFIYLFFV